MLQYQIGKYLIQ